MCKCDSMQTHNAKHMKDAGAFKTKSNNMVSKIDKLSLALYYVSRKGLDILSTKICDM